MLKKFNTTDLQKKIIKNSGLNFTSLIITTLASFLASIIVARLLLPSSAGTYFYLVWLIGTVSLLTSLGVPNALTRFLAESTAAGNKTLSQILLSRSTIFVILWGLILGFVVFALSPILPLPAAVKTYLWVVPFASVFLALQTIYGGSAVGIQSVKSLAVASLIGQPIFILALFMAGRTGNVGLMITITSASYFLTAVLLGASFLRKGLFFNWPRDSWNEVKTRFIKYARTVSIISILDAVVWQRSEVFFLGIFSGSREVAFYALAFGLSATAMKLIPGAFSGILLPTLTETHLNAERWVLRRRFYRATLGVVILVLPVILLGFILGPLAVSILYGHGYSAVVDVFKITLIGSGFGAIASISATLLYGTEKPGFILKFGLATAVVNIILDIYLISNFGLIGAAWANTTAQTFGAVGGITYVYWSLRE